MTFFVVMVNVLGIINSENIVCFDFQYSRDNEYFRPAIVNAVLPVLLIKK